jgi:tripartite-type tricarboxylate transporter receptor subunit TctC
MIRLKTLITVLGVAVCAHGTTHAQNASSYPSESIKIYVGSPPGAPSDVVARVLSDRLGTRFKQTTLVENRPGAGNNFAADQIAKSKPDGYMLLVSPDTIATVNPHIYPSNPMPGLVPVSLLASFSQMLVCGSQVKVSSIDDLTSLAKKRRVTYASGGAGVPGHLAAEMFITATGIEMDHIPYKGPSPAAADVLAGHVDCGFLTTPVVLPHVKSGRLTALAVSSTKPSALAPEVPTLAKLTGKPELDATFNQYLFVPKGTPATVIKELERAAAEIFQDPATQSKLGALDLVAIGSSSAEASKTLKVDIERWAPVVKRLNLKPN